MSEAPDVMGRVLAEGEMVVLHDRSGRRYQLQLKSGATHSLHSGAFAHDELIGQPDGTVVTTNRGGRLLALRPTFGERVTERRRRAQPIYPKDLGAILLGADIGPGLNVLEAGAGTGALSAALLRAVGSTGTVVSYELREEFLRLAAEAVAEVFGGVPTNWIARVANIYEGIEDGPFDRICLDVPEPWEAALPVKSALLPGGVLFSLSPNLSQVQRFLDALREIGGFGLIEVCEVLQRGWTVRGRSLRPSHRMVAHTAFLTFARRLAGDVTFEAESEGF